MLTLLLGTLVVLAYKYDGKPFTEVDLNDGGVWVTNRDMGLAARLNPQIKETRPRRRRRERGLRHLPARHQPVPRRRLHRPLRQARRRRPRGRPGPDHAADRCRGRPGREHLRGRRRRHRQGLGAPGEPALRLLGQVREARRQGRAVGRGRHRRPRLRAGPRRQGHHLHHRRHRGRGGRRRPPARQGPRHRPRDGDAERRRGHAGPVQPPLP
ncbi:hypothetical protein G5V59_07870 [Nocardioides sp. W3-2-3]|uniref:hypothetical protein n=1 Tax=Nocardioides convexus TaxID=2712224 RepID=UPI002418317A|nr:hypothetical protein [Nocardioides convexus]NHA00112.1 hypothetical protein [Nocardioides convexus]